MTIKELYKILDKYDPEIELSFIFGENPLTAFSIEEVLGEDATVYINFLE